MGGLIPDEYCMNIDHIIQGGNSSVRAQQMGTGGGNISGIGIRRQNTRMRERPLCTCRVQRGVGGASWALYVHAISYRAREEGGHFSQDERPYSYAIKGYDMVGEEQRDYTRYCKK